MLPVIVPLMSNHPQEKILSVRDINVLNQEWQRQLVGRKYVKHENDGFDDLKVRSSPSLSFINGFGMYHPF